MAGAIERLCVGDVLRDRAYDGAVESKDIPRTKAGWNSPLADGPFDLWVEACASCHWDSEVSETRD
jgi:hypothetical protein